MKTDDGKRVALPSVMGPNTKRRIAEKSSPAEAQASIFVMSITIQEGIDGSGSSPLQPSSAARSGDERRQKMPKLASLAIKCC